MTGESRVQMDVSGRVCTLTLVNPKQRNALTDTMMSQLEAAYRDIEASSEIRAVLLRGDGSSFCAGADIEMLARLDGVASARVHIEKFRRVYQGLEQLDRPTVCAVSGYALGAGLELCLAADLVITGEGARLGVPEAKLGAVPGYAMVRLGEAVGRARAVELMYTGRLVSAQQAFDWGLVNRVVPDDEVDASAAALVAELAAAAPFALSTIKRAVGRHVSETDWETFVQGASAALSTQDARRGTEAFLRKEKPAFTGS